MSASSAAGTQRYAVIGLLGKGGMGAVHRVIDAKDGKHVALKRLTPSSDETRQQRMVELFHQEFRTLAQLAHPSVVRVHDYGVDEQGPYYTMELLEGEDLQSLSPLPWPEACVVVRDVCSAVALLHSRRLLHRDLSPKNVKRMPGGRAKLIDFGAMTPMGTNKTVAGTAPMIAPEALMQQPLDARVDLYALGATLYFALTGQHAYPARDIAALRPMWRVPPQAPSERVARIPRELDKLVLSLLSLDPMARPRSAAEVLDRLTAIVSLPDDTQLAISNAYLSTPELVGRSRELSRVRARLRELHAGRGGTLCIEGAPGTGRSRMLDACVLEAKLSGVLVARASVADASAGAYGVLGVLLSQLSEVLPVARRAATHMAQALDLLRACTSTETDNMRRAELHAAVLRVIQASARRRPLLFAIDDIERCDEPSQAVLASAAQALRHQRVLLAVTCQSGRDHAGNTALSLLREDATLVRLVPLALAEVSELLGSVFGDVPYLQGLSARVHERAEGSPRGSMELAQYLVDRGLVQYRMGSWALPSTLDDSMLPRSLSGARQAKLEALSMDARELGEALALAEGSGLELDAYAELTTHRDEDRVRGALDELFFAQILRIDGAHYAFDAQVWGGELRDGATLEKTQMLCARVADALSRRGRDPLEVARYLWRGGDKARTVETVLAELARGPRWDRAPRDYGELLLYAVNACGELGRSRRERFTLLRELVKVGNDLAVPDMHGHLVELFAQLRVDTGLADFEALDPELPALERLQLALSQAQRRHAAAPELERGLSPLEAVTALAWVSAETASFAAQASDVSLLDLMLPLDAFAALSPSIARMADLTVPACRAIVAGRYEQASALYTQSLEALLQSDDGSTDEGTRTWSVRALRYALGCIEAGLGRRQALTLAHELEKAPGWLVPAWSIKRIYYGTFGNLREAEHCRQRIELLLLQNPVKPPLSAGAAHQHVYIAALSEDLTGLRRAIPEMEALAVLHPGFRAFVPFVRADHARVRGSYEEALVLIDQALAMLVPGQHPLWPWAVNTRLMAMLALGRAQDALELGLLALARAEEVGLQVMKAHIEIPLSQAETELGKHVSACERLDQVVKRREAQGMRGVVLGWAYEARARVALSMGDSAGFERNAQLCVAQYKMSGGDPALAAKYERLMQEARRRNVPIGAELPDAITAYTVGESVAQTGPQQELANVAGAVLCCASRAERVQRVLTLLVEAAGAEHGHLFLMGENGVALAASSPDAVLDDEAKSVVEQLVHTIREEDDVTLSTPPLPIEPQEPHTGLWPLLLSSRSDGETQIAGVAALYFDSSASVRLPMSMASAVARVLIDAADVTPCALGSIVTALPHE